VHNLNHHPTRHATRLIRDHAGNHTLNCSILLAGSFSAIHHSKQKSSSKVGLQVSFSAENVSTYVWRFTTTKSSCVQATWQTSNVKW